MAFTFDSLVVPGKTGAVKPGVWSVTATETGYMGVEGVSRIEGARGGRDLTCDHWLCNSYSTAAAADTALKTLEKKILKNATLVDSLGRSFGNCTLLEVHIQTGPVNSPPLAWMYVLQLKWRQLTPDVPPAPTP